METKKFIIPFIISLVVYFIIDYFFFQSMLYVLGGVIWGSLDALFGLEISTLFGILIGLVILAGFTVLFYRSRSKPLKYLIIIAIAVFLYIIDFIRMELVTIQATSIAIGVNVLTKSLALSLIIYFERKHTEIKKALI